MEIGRLKEFCHLADSLSFAETSRHFYMSQSVLSKHIASMEDELGFKLFSRDSHHVRLTEKGRVFRVEAESIIVRYDQALARLRNMGSEYSASVKIGYMRNASRPFIAQFVELMSREHPYVHVQLRCMEYGDLLYALSTGSVDMAFAINMNRDVATDNEVFDIFPDRFMAIMSLEHPLASRESIAVDELEQYPLLLPDPNVYTAMSTFIGKLIPFEVDSEYPQYQDIDTLFLTIMTSRELIGFSSEHSVPVFESKVRFLPVEDEDTSYNVSAIIPTGKKNPGLAACLDALQVCKDTLAAAFAKRAKKGLKKFE